MKITNVHVDNLRDDYAGGDKPIAGHYCAIGWSKDGFRFHVWAHITPKADGSVLIGDATVIYKNPPIGIEYKGEGYFRTIKLSPTAQANAPTLREVLRIVQADELYTKAVTAKAEKERREQEERDATILKCRKEDRAEELFELLRRVIGRDDIDDHRAAARLIQQIENPE